MDDLPLRNSDRCGTEIWASYWMRWSVTWITVCWSC